MEEDSFYNALYHVMWDMEVDIFSEKEKTCALMADLVPKCRKERRRLNTMYEFGAMDYIEKAVSDPENSKFYLQMAVGTLITEADMREERALDAVNTVAALWDSFSGLDEYDDINTIDTDGGEEEVIFVNDVSTEEAAQEEVPKEETASEQKNDDAGGSDEKTKENLWKKLFISWCMGDCEEGRPHMFADPMGWIMIILSCAVGGFMVYDLPYGDKTVIPTFVFTFMMLASKRLYRYESTAIFSLLIFGFYSAVAVRNIWPGFVDMNYLFVPFMLFSIIVFNNGRVSTWLDDSKKKSTVAYLIITAISAAITVGVFAIQRVVS
ncbi:MAG: hypothetical protein K2M82_05890 [Lachnospiraceae bacterium]|nr:hypothetical protein [Lachnospiraceae bacterium]